MELDRAEVERALGFIAHRGPDEKGIYCDHHAVLGHVRLRVIDLHGGKQPFVSDDGRYILVYNGEIYNFRRLRKELMAQDHFFHTRSDTEVLLRLFIQYGHDMLPLLRGIFAFAIWDKQERSLFVARDSFGVKPLFLWRSPKGLAVASEAKAFLAFPGFSPEMNLEAFHYYLNLRYVPGNHTLFRGVEKVPPGTFATLSGKNNDFHPFKPEPPRDAPCNVSFSYDDHVENIRFLLKRAVKRQLMSDVPLGVSLSGGLDSSSLVAMMAEAGADVKAFTVAFGEPTDEIEDARKVAHHFGASHHLVEMEAEPLQDLPLAVWHVEEPKVNAIQGYKLYGYVTERVTVLLSGLGGDELFGGYIHYNYLRQGDRLASVLRPSFLKKWLASVGNGISGMAVGRIPLKWDEYRRGLQMFCNVGRPEIFYAILRNAWDHDRGMWPLIYSQKLQGTLRGKVPGTFGLFSSFFKGRSSLLEGGLKADFWIKMISDFLVNEDRMSMAHGVEARVPFLDEDLVGYVHGLPLKYRMPGGRLKSLMKDVMRPYLPGFVLQKGKWGFALNPYHQFQKDLKKVASAFLSKERLRKRGFFNHEYLRSIIEAPPHPRLRWHYFLLWIIIGIELWMDIFLEGKIPERDTTIYDYL